MSITSRRRFLKQTSVGLAGLALQPWRELNAAAADAPSHDLDPALPKPMVVPGLHAYPLEKSVAAGQPLELCVSSTVPYQLSLCRLGLKLDDPAGDETIHTLGPAPACPQPIHPGSYVLIKKRLPGPLPAFTLESWVRPWKISAIAGLITQHDYPDHCGIGLFVNPRGGLHVYVGDGGRHRPDFDHESPPNLLQTGRWHHVVATWDGAVVGLWVDGRKQGSWSWFGSSLQVRSGSAPLRLGAHGESGQSAHLLDADLAMTAIYRRALSEEEVAGRFEDRGRHAPRRSLLWACWDFSEERGDKLADRSGNARHGQILNLGTWMIGGPSFQAEVPRFDTYDPRKDATRGHGLRLASDDLYDCGWRVIHRHAVPRTARPGLYVARFAYAMEGTARTYHTTFLVRKPARRKKAPIAVLCASNTWLAYNGTPFGITPPELKQVWGTDGTKNSPGSPPAYNLYRAHAAGQGTYQLGLRLPWPAAGPYILYGGPTDYSHLMRADRCTHLWLEQNGYAFDPITDLDLHRNPDQLRGYRVLFINGHNEYWSIAMYEGLRRYLAKGGQLACLSGNSLFWRVSFNDEATVMECRKVDAPGNQVPPQRRGEAWHSQDGLRGGMMREAGFPGWQLIGLDSLGWNNQSNPEQFGPYRVERSDHFLFQNPNRIDIQNGDLIGQAPDGGLPRANGHEIDVRPSTLKALQEKPSPAGQVVPDDPPGIVRLANGIIPWKKGGAAFDYFFQPIKPANDQGGEMIYWERPDGGRVFNAGAIGAGWALLSDPKLQLLLHNVLHHFGVKPKAKS